jgi:putative transposase
VSRPLRIEFPGALWHLTNRGVNRQDIFFCRADRRLFLDLLVEIAGRLSWIIHAWVQMTNHYHLLIETPLTNLSRGMKDLDGDFAQRINRSHGRTGHLFQGRFKSILVQRETHLLRLVRYIVLNPVRAKMVASAGEWEWSNYRATAGISPAPPWLETSWTLSQFHPSDRADAQARYRQFVAEGAGVTTNIWEELRCGLYLGTEAFAARLQSLAAPRANETDFPRRHRNPWQPELATLVGAFDDLLALPLHIRSDRTIDARKLFAWMARNRCGSPVTEIAPLLGVTPSGASKLIAAGRELANRRPSRSLIEAVEMHIERSRP